MNDIRKILLLNAILFCLAACTYDIENEVWCTDPPEVILPDSVALGESVLYLNGQKVGWTADIFSNVTILGYRFYSYDSVSSVLHRVSFSPVPLWASNFEVISLNCRS